MSQPEITQERDGWAKVPFWLLASVNPTAVVVYAQLAEWQWLPDGSVPAIPRVARKLKVSDRTVQRAIGELVEAGALTIETRHNEAGLQIPSRYHLKTSRQGDKSVTLAGGDRSVTGDKNVTRPVTPVSPNIDTKELDKDLSPDGEELDLLGGQIKADPKAERRARSDTLFAEFWSHYPKKDSKIAAKKRWDTLVLSDKVDPVEIIAGAKLYALACKNTHRKFWKDPAGWLNAGKWADESLRADSEPERDGPKPVGYTDGRELSPEDLPAW